MNIYKVHLLDQSLVISLTAVFQQGLAKEFSFKVNVTLKDIREYLLVSGAALHIDGVEFFKFCFPIMSDRRRAVPSLNSCQPLPTTMISQVFSRPHPFWRERKQRHSIFPTHYLQRLMMWFNKQEGWERGAAMGFTTAASGFIILLLSASGTLLSYSHFSAFTSRNFRGWSVYRCKIRPVGILQVASSFLTNWVGVAGVKPCVGVS